MYKSIINNYNADDLMESDSELLPCNDGSDFRPFGSRTEALLFMLMNSPHPVVRRCYFVNLIRNQDFVHDTLFKFRFFVCAHMLCENCKTFRKLYFYMNPAEIHMCAFLILKLKVFMHVYKIDMAPYM